MDFENWLYHPENQIKPYQGSLLIADPLMRGEAFARSVVLIIDIDKDFGHLGLVLNKSTDLEMSDLMPEWPIERKVPVFSGGPVDHSRLFMLHTLGDLFEGSTEIIPGIFVGGNIEQIMEYINEGGELEGKMRFFLGYSGWTKGQLQQEIENDVWVVADDSDCNPESLFKGSGNEFWRREVERLGKDYRGWLVVPQDPSLN